ncbi:hypothetical protein K7X08_022388 [Anisodus acutangulus]|uniref:Uncharacterized protein n=1 Tax=Anisodus acutangulus TaxID=402998 RepID=A0A9Q1MHX1_9SOLA|nr:hypothetical protein K7X08_022388 [Anisodus acutangulus]
MEDSAEDQSSVSVKAKQSSSKLLRYPLRSASKSKEEKPPLTDSSNSSASSRGRPASSVSKSVAALPLSKKKSAKPPRRLSVPSKSIVSPTSRPLGTRTPIAETRAKRSTSNQEKPDTPFPNVSKSSARKKYDLISSASYWLSQIKLSESAAKHSISLGFFKLALKAGSEPVQRLRDELKSYVRRHKLQVPELEEPVKQLFDSYNILQNSEQLKVSETCSHVPKDETRSSDDDVHSSSSVATTEKPKILNKDSTKSEQVKEPTKQKPSKIGSTPRTRNSVNKIAATGKSTSPKTGGRTTKERLQKPVKPELNKDKLKRQGKRSAQGEVPVNACTSDKVLQEDKENLDTAETEVAGSILF